MISAMENTNFPIWAVHYACRYTQWIKKKLLITFQTRARKAIVLVRLDIEGPPHRNPDGEEIICPHIHLYREGYGDKWAYPLPDELKSVLDRPYELLDKFMDYCHIIGKPMIQRELFI
ncbi:DUF6978 family protein [Glaesserella parasuis]|uniref:DUF6978 family protein n=2 Tax=Glaesserella parasuis TaxID=738 RepID=UPI00243665AD|nr:hypothetical protein [Glaesserella parasuis]MDG6271690.1 hypothetical protein [Glaesserella parasuis]MDG6316451.1 hypothetical protein [Glaesserella parasuis]MDG6354671.1 hypothetical protein [Glaesserella parasuis]MDG6829830.1 hypothetical protein [Glaesserella parasuis]MDG6851446.1 hypothetical protein [Glaesserella parasuis]